MHSLKKFYSEDNGEKGNCLFELEMVDLAPGDVLYIPPYWFHEVTSLDSSISVNVWTTSREEEVIDYIASEAVPFVDSFRPGEVDIMAFDMMRRIIHNYEKVAGSNGPALLQDVILQFVSIGILPQIESYAYLLPGLSCDDLIASYSEFLTAEQTRIVVMHSSSILEKLKRIRNSIQEIAFGIFVQWLASWGVGADKAVDYLVCVATVATR